MNTTNFVGIQKTMLLAWVLIILHTTYASTTTEEDRGHHKIRHWKDNNLNHLTHASFKPSSSKDGTRALQLSSNNMQSRCLINASTPEQPKYFFYHENELPIGILVSDRLTHKLASNVLKVFIEEVLGYVNVTLVNMADPSQGFDPDTQFSYISSCTDPA